MKDLLKDFTIKKALRQLSDESIDLLLTTKAGCNVEAIVEIRGEKTKKNKTAVLDSITAIARDHPDCVRALRVAYFFHKNRSAFIGVRSYFISKNIEADWDRISKGKSEAEQTIILFLEHNNTIADYFVICIHTHQGKSYCSCRTDYVASDNLPTESTLASLASTLLDGMKNERGSRYCGTRSFKHDGKIFLMLEFDDLPSHQREFEDGKDAAEDKFRRLALDLIYVFDPKSQTVETIAETAEIRLLMHRVCAATVFNQQVIASRPPKNEIFNLHKLLEYALAGTPISVQNSKSNVKQMYLDGIRIRRNKYPYWEIALSLKIPSNHAELQNDWVKDAHSLLKSVVNLHDDPRGWWHKSYIHATHVDLFVVYWDDTENKELSKKITVNSSGGTNLGHTPEDEGIKIFLRENSLLKMPVNKDEDSTLLTENHEEEFV